MTSSCTRHGRADRCIARPTGAPTWPLPLALLALLAQPGCSNGSGFTDSVPDAGRVDSTAAADATPGDAASSTPDQTAPPVPLSLATFNVRNLFDAVDDPHHSDDVPTAAEVTLKLQALGQALRQLDADVVALQEVENLAILRRLNQEQLAGAGYDHEVLVEGNDVRGIDVALLSRHPVHQVVSHAEDVFVGVQGDTGTHSFSRDCLEVVLEPAPGRRLVLLVNHLRAISWSDPDGAAAKRAAQAQRVRAIVDQLLAADPGANLAVLGDLNDAPDSLPLQLLRNGTPPLQDVLAQLPVAQSFTYGKDQRLDYILTAPGLSADVAAASATVLHDSVFADASDHYPVRVELTLH